MFSWRAQSLWGFKTLNLKSVFLTCTTGSANCLGSLATTIKGEKKSVKNTCLPSLRLGVALIPILILAFILFNAVENISAGHKCASSTKIIENFSLNSSLRLYTLLYIPTVISCISHSPSPIRPILAVGICLSNSSIHCLNNNLVCSRIKVLVLLRAIISQPVKVLPQPQGAWSIPDLALPLLKNLSTTSFCSQRRVPVKVKSVSVSSKFL